MMNADQFGDVLAALVETMPEELFEGLNGGVMINEEEKIENGAYVLGAYGRDRYLGRWIELYYGSFAAQFAGADDQRVTAALEGELRRLLRRHMLEQAGIYEEEDDRRRDAPPTGEST